MRKNTEFGRSMLEILSVLAVVGILSVAAFWGWRIAMNRHAAATLSDLVTKSAAGVVTSQYLDAIAQEYAGNNSNLMQITNSINKDAMLPVEMYISGVSLVDEDSDAADKFGWEMFEGPMDTLIAAYALENGRGLVVTLRDFNPEVCDLILKSEMEYEAVYNMGDRWDKMYERDEVYNNAALRQQICNPSSNDVLDVGFVFKNDSLTADGTGGFDYIEDDRQACNNECATWVLGRCMYINEPPCKNSEDEDLVKGSGKDTNFHWCDRKKFSFADCAWQCVDQFSGDNTCECTPLHPKWDARQQICTCSAQTDCARDEVCIFDEQRSVVDASGHIEVLRNKCEACPPNEIGGSDNTCQCLLSEGFYRNEAGECVCVPEGGMWSADKPCCAGLVGLSASTKESDRRCCPKNTYWDGAKCAARNNVDCCEAGTCWDGKTCKATENPDEDPECKGDVATCRQCDETNAATKCPALNQYCDTTTYTCKYCEFACGGKVSDDKLSCTGSTCADNQVCIANQIRASDGCYQESGTVSCRDVTAINWDSLPYCTEAAAKGNICRIKGAYNEGRYIVSDITMSYPAAMVWCQSFGWHLATREEACLKEDNGVNDGYNCYNVRGLFPYKADNGMNEHLWMSTKRSDGSATCWAQLSITNSCSDNHATNASSKLYALCAPETVETDSAGCGLGYYAQSGTSGCVICDAGHYCLGGTKKYACPAGAYCPQGTHTPIACSDGSYCDGTEKENTPCPAGNYCETTFTVVGDEQGAFPCPDGSGDRCTATVTKTVCPAGAYCPAGSYEPKLCPAGTYRSSTGGTAESSCTACPAGSYCPEVGMTAGMDCPAGSYCPTGSVNPTPCPASKFLSTTGGKAETSCKVCTAGHYCPDEGMAEPRPCELNTYQEATGQTECKPCEADFFAAPGSTSCQNCGAGTYWDTKALVCTSCPAGAYCTGNGKQTPCDENYYCPDVGMTTPTPCAGGTYTDATGQTECKTCELGNYCPEPQPKGQPTE